MILENVRAEILRRIHAAEDQHGVRVLLAVESGSRAWGFESKNSDYDVRFIYCHPTNYYLSIGLEEQRDVIEYPITDNIDLNGWDLRKALRLFWKSNPVFLEWVQSPIVYLESGQFSTRVQALVPFVFSLERSFQHYRSMALANYRETLRGDLVPIKKYFYVLRPLLAVRWLERYGTAVPIEFQKLLHLIEANHDLINDINKLLLRKRQAPELGLEPPVLSINEFIDSELKRLESFPTPKYPRGEVLPALDEVFRMTLTEV
jgi:predicted nucleotidyltransferase